MQQPSSIPDRFQLFIQGDSAAFLELFKEHKDLVYYYSYSYLKSEMEAEDVTAETFAELWSERAALNDPRHVKGFLLTVAKHRSIDILRRRKRTRAVYEEVGKTAQLEQSSTDHYMVQAEIVAEIDKEINKLPSERMRKVFLLRVYEQKSVQEVVDILGIGHKEVYNDFHIARQLLKAALLKRGLAAAVVFFLTLFTESS